MKEKIVSSIESYGADIRKFGLLSPENERKLCIEASKGNVKSRNKLITGNLRLVIKLAYKYKNLGLSVEDLICEGNKGLITAANNFDPKFNNRFSTYAYFWIKQTMLAAIKESGKWNSLSGDNVLNYENYTDKELTVNMNEFEVSEDSKHIKNIVRKIDGLSKRDSSIIKHYFGINGFTEMNTVELSEKYKITTMRVSSIIENSMRKIRCEILENLGD
jgi:RNA polymerase sigma factor (sigma-70 family)